MRPAKNFGSLAKISTLLTFIGITAAVLGTFGIFAIRANWGPFSVTHSESKAANIANGQLLPASFPAEDPLVLDKPIVKVTKPLASSRWELGTTNLVKGYMYGLFEGRAKYKLLSNSGEILESGDFDAEGDAFATLAPFEFEIQLKETYPNLEGNGVKLIFYSQYWQSGREIEIANLPLQLAK